MTEPDLRWAPTLLGVVHGDNGWQFDLLVPPDSWLFRGHFPELPLLPGVAQLQWAVQLYAQHSGDARGVAALRRLKFMRVVRPGERLRLQCSPTADAVLAFNYRNVDDAAVSSGQVLLRAPTHALGRAP